jgi:hypothetical protein
MENSFIVFRIFDWLILPAEYPFLKKNKKITIENLFFDKFLKTIRSPLLKLANQKF